MLEGDRSLKGDRDRDMTKPIKDPIKPLQEPSWWSKYWFYTVLILLAVIGVPSAFFIPALIPGLINDGNSVVSVRQGILAVLAGALTMLTLSETHRKNTYEKNKNERDHTRQVFAERRSRYAKAVEQLADEKAAVRLGGIYTLAGLVDEWLADDALELEEQRKEGQVIINNLCSYVRAPFPLVAKTEYLQSDVDVAPANYVGDFVADQAMFREEQDVRRTIFAEISNRSSTFTKDKNGKVFVTPGAWSDFDFDFSWAPIFYPLSNLTIEKAIFSSARFYGDANFLKTSFIQNVDFSRATFNGKAQFNGSNFVQEATFNEAVFNEVADFSAQGDVKTFFGGKASFNRVKFTHEANFNEADFAQKASFRNVIFTQKANFFKTVFRQYADFYRVNFEQPATFFEAKFLGEKQEHYANFYETSFKSSVDFCKVFFKKNADFRGAMFEQGAEFKDSFFAEEADFYKVTFKMKDADFTRVTFTQGTNFAKATFRQNVCFTKATFAKFTNFAQATFAEEVNFHKVAFIQYVKFSETIFERDTDFSYAVFSQDANFSNTIFFQNADFSKAVFFQNASFLEATFAKETLFPGAVFAQGMNFYNTHFKSSEPIFVIDNCKARFSALPDPDDYLFSFPGTSAPVRLGTARFLDKSFAIPLGTVLYDPSSWDEDKKEYTRISEPAQ